MFELLRSEQVNGLTLLQVNFDPSLVKLLREVHYFLLLPGLKQSIPASALKVGYFRFNVIRFMNKLEIWVIMIFQHGDHIL